MAIDCPLALPLPQELQVPIFDCLCPVVSRRLRHRRLRLPSPPARPASHALEHIALADQHSGRSDSSPARRPLRRREDCPCLGPAALPVSSHPPLVAHDPSLSSAAAVSRFLRRSG